MRRVRTLTALAALTAAGGTVLLQSPLLTQAAAAAPPPPHPHVVPPLTATELPPGAIRIGADGTARLEDPDTACGTPSSDPVPDNQDIVVSIPPGPSFTVGKIPESWWKHPPYGDSGWQLQLRGFIWVAALAQRAHVDGQKASLGKLVEQVLAFHRQNPDPGTKTAASTDNANHWGWDEGSASRRLGAENCLYSLTKDARLAKVMAADVAVQYGPRFYGPPGHIVHNHGVMADLAIIRAADLLGRADWRNRSADRLVANASGAWSRLGTTNEQSSSYHVFNTVLWGGAVDTMRSHGVASSKVNAVAALVDKANRVSPWLTEPDGNLVVLGDSAAQQGVSRSRWTARTFRDDQAGFTMGKWSWTDPQTTYYTIRYGPRRMAHGQEERAGITWTTRGRRVLVGPGKGAFDPAGNYHAWVVGPSSHNVATADRRPFNTRASVVMTASNIHAAWHTWATQDQLFGVRHVRQYAVLRDEHRLTVTDGYDGGAAFHQFWHLDPSWELASKSRDGRKLVFRSGIRALTVTTTGTAVLRRGVTRPVSGWNFPQPDVRVAANEIQVAAKGSATTTFVVG